MEADYCVFGADPVHGLGSPHFFLCAPIATLVKELLLPTITLLGGDSCIVDFGLHCYIIILSKAACFKQVHLLPEIIQLYNNLHQPLEDASR